MIRIKKREAKRKRIYITYEFSFQDEMHERKISYLLNEYNTFTEQEIGQRIRGAANSQRLKLRLKADKKAESKDIEE